MTSINSYPIKIKATYNLKTQIVKIKSRLSHPMETGLRKDDQGVLIPTLFIQEIHILLNDKEVIMVDSNSSFAKNPNFTFFLVPTSGAKIGDKITISWIDSQKNTQIETVLIEADEETQIILKNNNHRLLKDGLKKIKGVKNNGQFKLNEFKVK